MSEINYNCSLRDNNLKVLQGYGLTETTAIVASMFTEEETERYRSSGLLSPNVEAKIVDQERVVSWGLIKLANSGSGVLLWWKVFASSLKRNSFVFGVGMKLCWVAFKGYFKNEESYCFYYWFRRMVEDRRCVLQ